MSGMNEKERIKFWKEEISDIERCLAGDPTSKRFQVMNVELAKMKGSIVAAEQREINQSIPGIKGVPDGAHKTPYWWERSSYT